MLVDDHQSGADDPLIVRSGGSDNYQDKGQKGWSFQDDLTFTGWSSHTVKMGVKYKQVDLQTLEQNRYNPQFFYDINESLTVPVRVQFGAPVAGYGDGTASSDNKQFGTSRLADVLKRAASRSAAEIIQAAYAAVLNHADGSPQQDDLTAVVIRRVR